VTTFALRDTSAEAKTRKRRSAEESREEILVAAERQQPGVDARFRAWLGNLLAEHLAPPRR